MVLHKMLGCALGTATKPPFIKIGTAFADGAWLRAACPDVDFEGLGKLVYRTDIAQDIRDRVGVPSGIEVGIQTGVTPGSSGSLTAGSGLLITSESVISTAADSGTGTEADPYVISDKLYDGGGAGGQAIYWDHAAADYYIRFENCEFKNYNQELIQLEDGGSGWLEFNQCTFHNNVLNAELFLHVAGNMRLINCKLAGCNSVVGYFANAGAAGSLYIRNLLVDNSETAWRISSEVFWILDGLALDIRHVECDLATNANVASSLFQISQCADNSIISNFKVSGGNIDHALNDTRSGAAVKNNMTVQYFDIEDTNDHSIFMSAMHGGEISYGRIAHLLEGTGARPFYLESSSSNSAVDIDGVTIHSLRLNKVDGAASAGNEAFELTRPINCTVYDIWVENAIEDGFEIVQSRGNNRAYNLVLDNVAGQALDWFQQWNESSWAVYATTGSAPDLEDYVSFVYGDCGAEAIILSGVRGVVGHDIYIDNSAASAGTDYILCTTQSTAFTFNCKFAGPLALPGARVPDGAVFSVETSGTGNEARFFDRESGAGFLTILPGSSAWSFVGTTGVQYEDDDSTESTTTTTNCTFSGWLHVDQSAGTSLFNMFRLAADSSPTQTNGAFGVRIDADLGVTFSFDNGVDGVSYTTPAGAVKNNQYNHIYLSVSRPDSLSGRTWTLYIRINGVNYDVTQTFTSPSGNAINISQFGQYIIGADQGDTRPNLRFSEIWYSNLTLDPDATNAQDSGITNFEAFNNNGVPADLGTIGDVPTGTTPQFYMFSPAAKANEGTGIDPSENDAAEVNDAVGY